MSHRVPQGDTELGVLLEGLMQSVTESTPRIYSAPFPRSPAGNGDILWI